ncbi:class I SAM-dependent DNA methyltransferase [Enterococcus sp. BWR-S5]|uniref:class I SAM-dependent DNA methyltransferase n=1 Tax=Enterococcus sp. BWR-S5 TaxID=2787714 RepID=UPI0019211F10|nr:class I SAM-dependent methyltransferase [Enterococcus sp. BWR-S5]MBL1224170.1 class I SAM-dependent methyltransferase [Enterococcus sp. BWR-S5]
MGLEFMPIFEEWAADYDEEVNGSNPEYQEVFAGYWETLAEITKASRDTILEFGSGTGNLTEKLVAAGKTVYPIEPSPEMRQIAESKPTLQHLTFLEGDMENFPELPETVDTIVSNLVFHHLTAIEKRQVIKRYHQLLPKGGKIIFGDTMFLSQATYAKILTEKKALGENNLVADLEREYYPLMEEVEEHFTENGFQTMYRQMNRFVWLVIAKK